MHYRQDSCKNFLSFTCVYACVCVCESLVASDMTLALH